MLCKFAFASPCWCSVGDDENTCGVYSAEVQNRPEQASETKGFGKKNLDSGLMMVISEDVCI